MEKVEIGIVGGGLSGLSLAILLARQGRSVVLWEKHRYPFHRVCGEYISNESLPFLKSLLPRFRWEEMPHINTLLLSAPSGKMLTESLDLGGFGVSRFLLDSELAAEAICSGVQLFQNCPVHDFREIPEGFIVVAGGQEWQCQNLFLSFGKNRGPGEAPRKHGNGRQFVGVKYHIRYPHKPGEIQLHNFRNGYCGMSRIEDGLSCLCYLVDASELRSFGNDFRTMEAGLLCRNPHLRRIFEDADFLWERPKTISGIRFGEFGAMQGKAILLGDAAGSIPPLCGNGMSMALHAAKNLAADFSVEMHAQVNQSRNYRKFRKQQFGRRMMAGSLIQRFFGKEVISELALQFLEYSPGLRKILVRSTHGSVF